jgi:hypothetical protein
MEVDRRDHTASNPFFSNPKMVCVARRFLVGVDPLKKQQQRIESDEEPSPRMDEAGVELQPGGRPATTRTLQPPVTRRRQDV